MPIPGYRARLNLAVAFGRWRNILHDRRRCGELDTAAGTRTFVIGSVYVVFMRATVNFAPVVVPGNNTVRRGPMVAVGKMLAVVGKGVGGPDQWPEDDQNPGDAQQGAFVRSFPQQPSVFLHDYVRLREARLQDRR